MSQPTLDPDFAWNPGIGGQGLREQGIEYFAALLSKLSGATEPNPTFPYMSWIDLSVVPAVWRIRTADNLAWNDFAQINASGSAPNQITLLNAGVGIPSLGVTQTFTASQRIKPTAAVGELTVGSTLQSGVVARIPLIGHNSNNAETVGANLVLRQNVNSAGAEDFTIEFEARRGGSLLTVVSLGSGNIFRNGADVVADFDELRQAGTSIQTIIDTAKARVETRGSFTGNLTLEQADAGAFRRYNGAGNITITVPRLTQGSWVMVINDSSDNGLITFAPDPGQTEIRTPRLILRGVSSTQSPTCVLFWFLSVGQLVNIFGDNTVS
ncbi:MAG: hypothetical protein ACR2RE_17655 [Geminicoccaceae bacterium]